MGAMLGPRRLGWLVVSGVLWCGGMSTYAAYGGDLVTLSGTTYHDVRPVRVDPDGVTWQYDEGICKVDFTDSPKSVCEAYHFDPVKAASYRDAQAQMQRRADEQRQQILQENEQRTRARMQAAASATVSRDRAGAELIYRRAVSPAASVATRELGEQMAAAEVKQAAEPTGAWGILAHSRVGKILSGLGLVNFGPPGPPPNKEEFKVGSHHTPGVAFPVSTALDPFFRPDYETRSYYEDVDRSAAFLRAVPLKP